MTPPLSTRAGGVSLLPGPPLLHPSVRRAMGEAPISHRSPEFVDRLERCRRILCKLTGAANVQVFVGSGTAANDTVAAQLALRGEIGLVLHAGEFGHRLCDHARRAGLEFHEAQARWGSDHDFVTARRLLEEHPEIRWIWSVHCETSTGRLHDLDPLRRLAESHHADLVLDCISSVGAVPIDLSGIAFATAVSGKALASFAGLAMVFHSRPIGSDSRLPRSLDLGAHAQSPTVPFTQSSNLVGALEAALSRFQSGGRCTVEPRWQAARELAASSPCSPTIFSAASRSSTVKAIWLSGWPLANSPFT